MRRHPMCSGTTWPHWLRLSCAECTRQGTLDEDMQAFVRGQWIDVAPGIVAYVRTGHPTLRLTKLGPPDAKPRTIDEFERSPVPHVASCRCDACEPSAA